MNIGSPARGGGGVGVEVRIQGNRLARLRD